MAEEDFEGNKDEEQRGESKKHQRNWKVSRKNWLSGQERQTRASKDKH